MATPDPESTTPPPTEQPPAAPLDESIPLPPGEWPDGPNRMPADLSVPAPVPVPTPVPTPVPVPSPVGAAAGSQPIGITPPSLIPGRDPEGSTYLQPGVEAPVVQESGQVVQQPVDQPLVSMPAPVVDAGTAPLVAPPSTAAIDAARAVLGEDPVRAAALTAPLGRTGAARYGPPLLSALFLGALALQALKLATRRSEDDV